MISINTVGLKRPLSFCFLIKNTEKRVRLSNCSVIENSIALSLSMTYGMIQELTAVIRVTSKKGKGTKVVVEHPLKREKAEINNACKGNDSNK